MVLVRETSAPQWQQRYPMAGTTADLPISKDNFIFGVASVDATGHESVADLGFGARAQTTPAAEIRTRKKAEEWFK